MKTTKKAYAPNGWYPDGRERPLQSVTIVKIIEKDNRSIVICLDEDGKTGLIQRDLIVDENGKSI